MTPDLTEADRREKGHTARRALLALALPFCLALTGCMSSGSSAVSALSVDQMTTAAITPLSADSEIMSDEMVIRDLVGGLEQGRMHDPLPWSNALTGSAGVMSRIETVSDGTRACREFETTRHGFDGVALYDGRVCRRPDGGWDLISFERAGS
ncbi:RT0821/Lpp0805 family surface protein [Hoeflea ulvae]|uniref:RT0821/Lpp0805 family surface protein n=1 Tax=Hoeflea ulvae TaxID=2983764 RepID=A0ABT3YEC8_9HYPH|nr:RT0821/Lpp0805 family surface protein [Hoeflea ulvae]MCY0094154.1 RT0821/Lpp0805 family surface protein [Hoeflea ulvae]